MKVIKMADLHIRADAIVSIGQISSEPELYYFKVFFQGSQMAIACGSHADSTEEECIAIRDKYEQLWLKAIDAEVVENSLQGDVLGWKAAVA